MVPWAPKEKDRDVWRQLDVAAGDRKIKPYYPATQLVATER